MNTNEKPLALVLADWLEGNVGRSLRDEMAAAELRRLHARVAELEAAPAPVAPDQPTEREEQMAELLRSACAIADRQGAGTHWQRFGDSIRALGLNGITARTYQVLPSDREGLPAAPAPVARGGCERPYELRRATREGGAA